MEKLKILAVAYKIAINYDRCQNSEYIDDIIETYGFDRDLVTKACNEYFGERPDEIVNEIIRTIEQL